MKCTEFRDISELLRDGALEAAGAEAARAHLAGCASCRSFEEECAVLVAPLRGLPPGPYLPPVPPGRLPPWASGPTFAALMALLLVGGGAAWALLGTGRHAPRGIGRGEAASAPRTERHAAPVVVPASDPPAPSVFAAVGGATIIGRAVTFPGGKPVEGAAIRVDGVPAATTDAAGTFLVRDLADAGSRLLRVEPPGGTPSEALLPRLTPGQVHALADLLVGRPGPATIRVVRWDALPAAGVRVRACRLASTVFPDSSPTWEPGSAGDVLPALASALTDAEGVAEFPALAPGTWTFQAEREGLPFSAPANLDVIDDPDLAAALFLDPATALEGRVLDDATGSPVGGATVRWSRIGLKRGTGDFRSSAAVATDAGGGFRFRNVPAVPLLLEVRRPGAPCTSGVLAVDASRVERVDLRLPPTGALAGICVEAGTGLPAAGAVLRITSSLLDGMAKGGESVHVRSGPDGRFEVRGLPETALLLAEPQPLTSWCRPGPPEINYLRAGTPCRIEVARTGSVAGVVRDATGLPAPGRAVVALEILPTSGPPDDRVARVGQALSDSEGRFTVGNLRPGRAAVFSPEPQDIGSLLLLGEGRRALQATDSPPLVATVRPAAVAPVTVAVRGPEPSTAVTVPGSRKRHVRGRILDSAGAPVPGASLFVLRGDLTVLQRDRNSRLLLQHLMGTPSPVAEDGAFVAEIPSDGPPGAPRAEAVSLLAQSPRHPLALAVVRIEGGEDVEGVLVPFEEGFSVSGRILHEDGTPAAGALLEAVEQEDAQPSGNTVMVRARAAEDGSFRIDGLTRRPHTLVVGRGPGPIHPVAGLLPGGGPVEIRLPPGDGVRPRPPAIHPQRATQKDPERTASIQGRILGSGGTNVMATSVLVFETATPGDAAIAVLPDETGHFECRVPPGRRFCVAADLGDGRWLYADDVTSDSRDTVLRIGGPFTGLLKGRVVTPAGAPAARVPVHAVRLGPPAGPALPGVVRLDGREWADAGSMRPQAPLLVRTSLTGSDGSFDLGSPPGRWSVFAGFPGSGEPAPGPPVPWSSADPRVLEVPLVPGRLLRVRGVDDDAPPEVLPPAWAEMHMDGFLPGTEGPGLAVRLAPGPGGFFEFRGLPPGRVTVLLLDDRRREIGRATAEPGDDRAPPVEIRVRR